MTANQSMQEWFNCSAIHEHGRYDISREYYIALRGFKENMRACKVTSLMCVIVHDVIDGQ